MSFPRFFILYATQSGVSEDIAQRIYRMMFRIHLQHAELYIMDKFDYRTHLFQEMQSKSPVYCIFVCSTAGQGNAPVNMQQMWRYMLLKKHNSETLKHVQFTVFGLGDSGYPKYNFVAKKLYRRLCSLGANPFHERGFGDDQHPWGIEGGFQPWQESLKQTLLSLASLKERGLEEIPENEPFPPQYRILPPHEAESKSNLVYDPMNSPYIDHSEDLKGDAIVYERSTFAIVEANQRMTPTDHFQDVRHVVLDISGTGLKFAPGDSVALLYTNPESEVEKLMKRLEIQDELVAFERLHANAKNLPFHTPTLTWKEIFTKYLDICGTPTRFFYEQLRHFVHDENEKERLDYLLSPEGTDDFWKYNQREKRTYLEALEDFSSARFGVEYVLDIIRPIQPRYFSISSSQNHHSDKIHLTIGIVEFETPYGRKRVGKCSNWISSLPVGSRIPLWISKGTLQLPPPNHPMIMIGPGTGVAPFKAFIEERVSIVKNGQTVGDLVLFFGCRYEKKDYYYGEYWLELKETIPLRVITAFSRDQPQKIYVQHRILEHAEMLWDLITFKRAYMFIVGSSNDMPKGVRNMLIQVAQKCGGKSYEEAQEWVDRLEKQGRYQVETW